MKEPLTRSERLVYKFYIEFIRRYGYYPTMAEVAEGLEYASRCTVHQVLHSLARKGWMKKYGSKRYTKAFIPVDLIDEKESDYDGKLTAILFSN